MVDAVSTQNVYPNRIVMHQEIVTEGIRCDHGSRRVSVVHHAKGQVWALADQSSSRPSNRTWPQRGLFNPTLPTKRPPGGWHRSLTCAKGSHLSQEATLAGKLYHDVHFSGSFTRQPQRHP